MKTLKRIVKSVLIAVSIILFVMTLLGGYGGFINPDKWALPSMLSLLFPLFVVLTFVTAICWDLARARVMSVVADLTVVACVYPFFVIAPVNFDKKPTPGAPVVKVLSYNILHTRDNELPDLTPAHNRTLAYIMDSGADIVCVQEYFNFRKILKKYPEIQPMLDSLHKVYPYATRSNNVDCGVLSKYPLTVIPVTNITQKHVHYILCWVQLPGGRTLNVMSVHLPSYELSSKERDIIKQLGSGVDGFKASAAEFKNTVYGKIKYALSHRALAARFLSQVVSTTSGDLIVCGDFNDVPGSWAWRTLRDAGLEDAYCDAGRGMMYTFNAHYMYFHIDQMLYRGNLRPLSIGRGDLKSSDHYPLTGEFELTNN